MTKGSLRRHAAQPGYHGLSHRQTVLTSAGEGSDHHVQLTPRSVMPTRAQRAVASEGSDRDRVVDNRVGRSRLARGTDVALIQ